MPLSATVFNIQAKTPLPHPLQDACGALTGLIFVGLKFRLIARLFDGSAL
jgi:hypothetical protein